MFSVLSLLLLVSLIASLCKILQDRIAKLKMSNQLTNHEARRNKRNFERQLITQRKHEDENITQWNHEDAETDAIKILPEPTRCCLRLFLSLFLSLFLFLCLHDVPQACFQYICLFSYGVSFVPRNVLTKSTVRGTKDTPQENRQMYRKHA